MFGNNDGFTKHPTKSTTVINEPPSSVLPLIYLNMCDSFLGQHLALLFVTLRYTWWLKRAATTAEASAVCTFSFAKAYTVTCLVESLCGVFTPGCTRLTNVKLSQAFKELAQWQESTSMTTPETVRQSLKALSSNGRGGQTLMSMESYMNRPRHEMAMREATHIYAALHLRLQLCVESPY